MSLQIAQLSLKCEPLVSASGTGVAGLRWNGADRFTWQQIFCWHPPGLLRDSGLTDAAGASRHQVRIA